MIALSPRMVRTICALLMLVLSELHLPNTSAQTSPPKVTSANREAAIQRLFAEAQTFYDSAYYDLARRRYEQILVLDPGNVFALDGARQATVNRAAADALGQRGGSGGIKLSGDWIYPVSTWEVPRVRPGLPPDWRKITRTTTAHTPLQQTWLYRAAEAGARMNPDSLSKREP